MSKHSLRYRSEADMPEGMRGLLQRSEGSKLLAVTHGPMGPVDLKISSRLSAATTSPPTKRHAPHRAGEMNKTEARYAQQLEARRIAGEIRWYAFERVKLRLADRTYFTVDFFVQLADGSFECHEVKGRKGDRYWAEEDAKLKIKVAAEMFPVFRFLIVWPAKGGGWCQEQFG